MGRGENTWFCQGLPIGQQHASGHRPRVAEHRPSGADSKVTRVPRPHLNPQASNNNPPTTCSRSSPTSARPPTAQVQPLRPPRRLVLGPVRQAPRRRLLVLARAFTARPPSPGYVTLTAAPLGRPSRAFDGRHVAHAHPHDQAMIPPPPEEWRGTQGYSSASLLPATAALPGGQTANATQQVRRWTGDGVGIGASD